MMWFFFRNPVYGTSFAGKIEHELSHAEPIQAVLLPVALP